MGSGIKEKKSFKKFAKKHLAGAIQARRKTAQSKKEKKERLERKKTREAKTAAKEEQEHVEQLERLKETDPDFYSFLEDEDPTLLQFGKEDMEVMGDDEGSDAETDVDEEEGGSEEAGSEDGNEADEEDDDGAGRAVRQWDDQRGRISTETLTKLRTGEPSEENIRQSINVFVCAAREMGYKLKENPLPVTTRKFDDPELVKTSLVTMAQHVAKNISVLLTVKGSVKSKSCRHLVRRLLFAITTVIGEGSIDATLTTGLLSSVASFVPVLHHVKGLTKSVLKTALQLCSASEESVRVAAYLVVRSVATRATGTRSMYQSAAFKGIFLSLIRSSHQYTVHNQASIAFLINCVVDLYGTDLEAAYQHTFVYLRQLAIYLRAALQQQSLSNVRAVVNWQYLNALRTWGAVISTYSSPDQLGPLIHPVVQIATCLMDLFSSPRMFPMHLQIVEVLNHIAVRADGVYIPVTPYLLRILTSPSVALTQSGGGSGKSGEAVELPFTMRVKKSQARNPAYHQAVWTEALYLLTEHLATHSCTVGFPETFWAVDSTLKKLRGEVKVPRIHSQVTNIIKNMQAVSQMIVAKRDQANFGPCDLAAVKAFENECKQQGNLLKSYHLTLRQQRVDGFVARQRNATEERLTLEKAATKRAKRSVGKRPREE